jgi:hypothetical protein
MTATIATLQAALKTYYPQSKIRMALFSKAPLLARLKKSTKWVGNPMHIGIQVAPTAGGSHTFDNAQSNIGPTIDRNWLVTHANDYSIFRIAGSALRAGARDQLMQTMKSQTDGAMNTLRRSMAIGVFRNHGGARGRILSGGATTIITLTDRRDAVNFEQGMRLVSDSTDGSAGGSSDGFVVEITGVDYAAGTLRAAAAWNTAGGFADNAYLFRDGDFGASMRGLDSWFPAAMPTLGESFFGLDRSQNSRLIGTIHDYSVSDHGSFENYLITFSGEMGRLGASPNLVVMNNRRRAQLVREIGSKVAYGKLEARGVSDSAEISFKTVTLAGEYGDLEVLSDPNCPYDSIKMLNDETLTLYSMGEIGFFDHANTGNFLSVGNSDSVEGRMGGYMQLVCEAPFENGTGSLAALAA